MPAQGLHPVLLQVQSSRALESTPELTIMHFKLSEHGQVTYGAKTEHSN
jgi:hypothetical protein